MVSFPICQALRHAAVRLGKRAIQSATALVALQRRGKLDDALHRRIEMAASTLIILRLKRREGDLEELPHRPIDKGAGRASGILLHQIAELRVVWDITDILSSYY
ncbi:hypothetical protein NKI71_25825 [Mesorhizobium sp. M0510]|uniref:hypothetical protein n=1 Tax=Mesorhizobium sp. M0510 TaxID=2956954 RepID=UPI00333BEC7E